MLYQCSDEVDQVSDCELLPGVRWGCTDIEDFDVETEPEGRDVGGGEG